MDPRSQLTVAQRSTHIENLTFIDLFSGLGGFHQALTSLGHQCVFASELDVELRNLYRANFDVEARGDIREIEPIDIPDHDILCAGFPCQSFSKAGKQKGLSCPDNGDLIEYVLRIVKAKRPKKFILENVPNLERHDGGKTFERILESLKETHDVNFSKLSPHEFGIPQVRERLFIVGDLNGLTGFEFPVPTNIKPDIRPRLDHYPSDARQLSPVLERCISIWQEFVETFPKQVHLPSFPIWSMEFGANYDLNLDNYTNPERLAGTKGKFGIPIDGKESSDELRSKLPHYAWSEGPFPKWKQLFIAQNRSLYYENEDWINNWLPKIMQFSHSLQKLEWNCKGEERDIWKHVLQVRASGLRVKRATTSPSLVAMTSTQVPIIGWEKRYMTPRECARIQSMTDEIALPSSQTRAFKALGNAVNVQLVEMIALQLLNTTHTKTRNK